MASANHLPSPQPAAAHEPRDARRRRELIEATIASIARHGLSGTTLARVAEIAELSAGIVSFYFRTKEALLLAALEHIDAEFESRRLEVLERAGEDPVSQLDAIIETYFDPTVCDAGRVAVWAAFWGEAQARESYQRVCGARDASEEQHLVRLFEQIAARGDYAHLDPSALGAAFHHLLSSLPEAMLEGERSFDCERAKRTCRSFLASVFPAEFPRAASAERARPARRAGSDDASAKRADAALPAWAYFDPEFHELEREQIFKRHWLMVGHVSQVPAPGDYMTLDAVGERALVLRARDGSLRAFHNVCRHRASRVVRGASGNCGDAIACPYHGWRYALDGSLLAVPGERHFGELAKRELGLAPLELEIWMGIAFVRFGGDGPGVAASLRALESELLPYGISEMRVWGEPETRIEPFNWKSYVENGSEAFPIANGHPRLEPIACASDASRAPSCEGARSRAVRALCGSAASGERAASSECGGTATWSERAYARILPHVPQLPESRQRSWLYCGLFPAFAMRLSPDLVSCIQVLPLGPDSCSVQRFSIALDDERPEMRAARYLQRRLARRIARADREFCRSTYEGIRSAG
ncbi:MAG TPA: Rieske 2Fe-2S domain-containing protein, partial [Myxococcota bacterium]|nr:Rieske 2Fe-2S domain-containing protein [Myxococcota bacterium]